MKNLRMIKQVRKYRMAGAMQLLVLPDPLGATKATLFPPRAILPRDSALMASTCQG